MAYKELIEANNATLQGNNVDLDNLIEQARNLPNSGGSGNAEIPWLTREITEYSNDTLTHLGAYALSGTNLTSLNLPTLATIAGYAFYECGLAEIRLPALMEIPYNGFRQYKGLVTADLPMLNKIGSNGFYQCTNLTHLILRSNRICSIVTGSVLTASKVLSGDGYVYVPRALLSDTDANSDYRRATNWSVLTKLKYRALEDYTVDGTTTGALDPNKI